MQNNLMKKLTRYFDGCEDYAFVLLFGSQSDGKAAKYSDIDIGLCFKADADYLQAGYEQAQLERRLRQKVDVIVLNGLARRDPLAAFEILAHHSVVAMRNDKMYIAFKTETQLMYLDNAALIEANRQALNMRIESKKAGERNYA